MFFGVFFVVVPFHLARQNFISSWRGYSGGKEYSKAKDGRETWGNNALSNLWFGSTPNVGLFKQSLLGKMALSK